MRRFGKSAWLLALALGFAFPVACGSKTGLLEPRGQTVDASTAFDAGSDAPADASEEPDVAGRE